MSNDDIDMIVEKVIHKLANQNHVYIVKRSSFKKTEEVLYKYNLFKTAIDLNENTKRAKQIVELVDHALDTIKDDEYFELIRMIFFENQTREYCADYFKVEPITVTRNKNRLVNKLKNILFPDDAIDELYH